jgi:DNA polymerase-3 subunit epsilon
LKTRPGGNIPRYIALSGALLLLGALAAAFWMEITAQERAVLREILDRHPALIISAAFLLPCAVVIAVLWIFRQYTEPLRKLVDEMQVMNLVNPSHRLAPEGSAQIRQLSLGINRALERIQDLQRNVDESVRASRQTVEEEKAVLEALIQDFPDGVIVCNADCRILLYNRRAREILTPEVTGNEANAAAPSYVGLGRSVFGFIDRDLILHALQMIEGEMRGGKERARARFVTMGSSGELLHVEASPVAAGTTETRGCILVLHDISAQTSRDTRRESLLESLIERVRSSLATLRTAVELLVDHPGLDEAKRERLTHVIREESFSLSAYLETSGADAATGTLRQWPLEEMLSTDVAGAVKRGAEKGLDVTMALEIPAERTFVSVESFTLVQALVFVTGSIKNAAGGTDFAIRPGRNESLASIDIRWRGKPLPASTLRDWEKSRIRIAGQETALRLEEVLKRHDAELWSGAEEDGVHAHVRLVLPRAEGPAAGPSGESHSTLKSRPEFYDFDLFSLAPGSPTLRESPLQGISFTAFDTETTGLRPSEGDEIVSIGAVRIVNGRMLRDEAFDHIVDPGRPISRESTEVHGIDDAMVAGRPPLTLILPAFSRFAQDTVLVGHNAAFDMRFFQIKEGPTGVKLRMPVLDTMLLSAVVHPNHDDHSLEGIAGRLGVNITGRHTALGDAIVTGEVFLRLIPLLADKGIRTLGEALEASKGTPLAKVKY